MRFLEGLRAFQSGPRTVSRSLALLWIIVLVLVAALALQTQRVLPGVAAFALVVGALFSSCLLVGLLSAQIASVRGRRVQDALLSQIERSGSGKRRAVLFDETTGLYQRWYFDLRLEEEYLRCKRYDQPMAIIVLKMGALRLGSLSMDEWGRLATDLGHITAGAVRAVDLVGVLGPMEFAICLVSCDREGAEAAVRRIISELGPSVATIGMTLYPDDNCDSKTLLELARGRGRPATLFEEQAPAVAI